MLCYTYYGRERKSVDEQDPPSYPQTSVTKKDLVSWSDDDGDDDDDRASHNKKKDPSRVINGTAKNFVKGFMGKAVNHVVRRNSYEGGAVKVGEGRAVQPKAVVKPAVVPAPRRSSHEATKVDKVVAAPTTTPPPVVMGEEKGAKKKKDMKAVKKRRRSK